MYFLYVIIPVKCRNKILKAPGIDLFKKLTKNNSLMRNKQIIAKKSDERRFALSILNYIVQYSEAWQSIKVHIRKTNT